MDDARIMLVLFSLLAITAIPFAMAEPLSPEKNVNAYNRATGAPLSEPTTGTTETGDADDSVLNELSSPNRAESIPSMDNEYRDPIRQSGDRDVIVDTPSGSITGTESSGITTD
tara:strand:+ start:618 stop:959 length:342 start_codon:yes stop_codon:yes gene_type:complete